MRAMHTVNELAAILKVKPKTVYRMVERRQIPAHKVGNRLRFTDQDVETFLDSCRVVGE